MNDITINKILLPVDMSEASPLLVPFVRLMGQKFGAEIHVLFVARLFKHLSAIYVPDGSIEVFEADVLRGAEKKLQEFMDEYFRDTRSPASVVSGDPAEEILKYAEREEIDMIIMGTHGRKGLERVLFGSVAEYVVKNALVPVLTVNPYRQPA
ncbi:MAG: universal stress protein [Proteobacteria bacterium]|nr:universal stress protein [Pseudomonadota bacterium]